MKLNLRIERDDANDSDVFIDADEVVSIGELETHIAKALGVEGTKGLWVGQSRLDESAPVSESALRQGSAVSLGQNPHSVWVAPPQAGWLLLFISGPDAGTIINLPVGRHEIGRMQHGLKDASMSRRHAAIDVTVDGASIVDLGSANGTIVDGKAVVSEASGASIPILPGQIIAMGDSLATISLAQKADAPTHSGPEGTVEFTRPPRLRQPSLQRRIAVPMAPEGRKGRRFPLAALLAPLALGVVMAEVEHQATFLLFTLASPIMLLANLFGDRRQSAKDFKEAKEKYTTQFGSAMTQLEEALIAETDQRRSEFLDPASAYLVATLPGRRVWERRRTDADALQLRLGTADLPSRVEVDGGRGRNDSAGIESGPRVVYSVPAAIDLRECGVMGLAGPTEVIDAMARWLVIQLALFHPPRDLSLTLLTSRQRSTWSWLRWVPHAAPQDADFAMASIGNDPETVAQRVMELSALVKFRREAARGTRAAFPFHVVVIDEARSMRSVQGLVQVLKDGPEVGVFAICLGEEDRFLPEECNAVITVDPVSLAYVTARRSGHGDQREILADQVSQEYVDVVARSLAPMRDVTKDDEEIPLPDSARLLDIIGFEPPTSDAVRTRWMLGGRTTEAALGIGSDGVFSIDLRRDGPHGLLAGTTGAGKSELLQSIIASLAVANRPDALNFVLVDYKGGSAFKDCDKLPHAVGMVTDLDAHLVERAIVSLGAELKRREHLLASAGDGAKDIEDYHELLDRGIATEPLARLVIVIDEFASMARELPDFVTGLVNVAQRGRSLGIHLILATQRPSGVVSQEIRANTNLRISLRVTDAMDSSDVIDAPDAARISKSTPGRAYVRLGHGALVPFQAGRIGGRRPGATPEHVSPPFVAELGWGQLGYPPPRGEVAKQTASADLTDLSELVKAIRQAATDEGFHDQPRPWLDALPERLLLADIPVVQPIGEFAPICYGLEDRPAEQVQCPATFDLQGGHLLVIGSSRSGRSQILRTIAGSIGESMDPNDVHLYGLDCGNGALVPLTALPHCGAVVGRSQSERALRLLARLARETERRQAALSNLGVADIVEQRRSADPADRMPHLVFMLDRWEGFVSSLADLDGGRPMEQMLNLFREGGSVGIHAIVTGDRSLASGRVGSLCDNKLALRLADKSDYTYVGLSPRQLPDNVPPGRGFNTETATEVQIALIVADESGQAQGAALTAIGELVRQRVGVDLRTPPFRVDELPSRISLDEALALPVMPTADLFAAVAVGGDELTLLGPDLAVTPAFIVAGTSRSGRSTALVSMARSLLHGGAEVVVVAPRNSPLRLLEGVPGVRGVLTNPSTSLEDWQQLLGIEDRPLVIVIDDGEDLKDSPAGELFRVVMQGRSSMASGMILGGSTGAICAGLSGWQVDAKKARQGLLLSPQNLNDGDIIGARLPRSAVGGVTQPGRGFLHLGDGNAFAVVVPIA